MVRINFYIFSSLLGPLPHPAGFGWPGKRKRRPVYQGSSECRTNRLSTEPVFCSMWAEQIIQMLNSPPNRLALIFNLFGGISTYGIRIPRKSGSVSHKYNWNRFCTSPTCLLGSLFRFKKFRGPFKLVSRAEPPSQHRQNLKWSLPRSSSLSLHSPLAALLRYLASRYFSNERPSESSDTNPHLQNLFSCDVC